MDEAFLNDLLECSVCLEQLDGNSKVLPCQHTFCKRCLEEIVNSHKELRCPECRILVETKVEDLPPNILLIRLLDGIKNNPRLKPCSAKKTVSSTNSLQCLVPPKTSQTHEGVKQVVSGGECKTTVKQTVNTVPCAKALYAYEGKERGDLSFKKGDMITLHRKINQNWYHGEFNGKYGFVPSRFLRVVVPLPTHVPQCKALFDFSVAENEEKDCLTFKKGEVITVIRKVDDNWAEGKLCDRIGIFPMSFVEMNVAARFLMKLSANAQPGPSKVAPPTPVLNSPQILAPPMQISKMGVRSIVSQGIDSLSSATTTPSPNSSTTPSPSSPPSSSNPSHQVQSVVPSVEIAGKSPSVLIRSASQRSNHQREKRHSLSSISSVLKSPQIPHKHSAEILSTAGGDILAAPSRAVSVTSPCLSLGVPMQPPNKTDADNVHTVQQGFSGGKTQSSVENTRVPAVANEMATSSVTSSNVNQAVPFIIYKALYSYRPKKDDELQLKKGEFYIVSEKCQDGWFKGTSLRTGLSGVFPGNYVHITKSLGYQKQFLPSSVANVRTVVSKSLLPVSVPQLHEPPTISLTQSPENFPDRTGHASNMHVAVATTAAQETRNSVNSVSVEPIPDAITDTSSLLPSIVVAVSLNSDIVDCQETAKESNQTNSLVRSSDLTPWMNNLSLSTTSPSSTSSQVTSLVPAVSRPSVSSHVQSEKPGRPTVCAARNMSQSLHAGRLLHSAATSMTVVSPPNVSLRASTFGHSSHSKSEKHKMRKDKARESLMKRFTGRKKTRLAVTNFCDNPSFVDSTAPDDDVTHVRSGLWPSGELTGQACVQPKSNQADQSVQEASVSTSCLKQPSVVRERFRCVVPYPPNSEYELELEIGDIVYVHKKREDGWYKGTLLRTGKTGLFPSSFVDSY